MSFLEDKKREATSGAILAVSILIACVIVPKEYVLLRFFVVIVLVMIIVVGFEWLKGEKNKEWQEVPLLVLFCVWLAMAFIGTFVLIVGLIYLALGIVSWDSVLINRGVILTVAGGATRLYGWLNRDEGFGD